MSAFQSIQKMIRTALILIYNYVSRKWCSEMPIHCFALALEDRIDA